MKWGGYNGLTKQLNATYYRITTDKLEKHHIHTQLNKHMNELVGIAALLKAVVLEGEKAIGYDDGMAPYDSDDDVEYMSAEEEAKGLV
ncbi:hypothetical protein ACEPPN_019271 [Leptodophora sp. 'Broadleaf-Isolate-01']